MRSKLKFRLLIYVTILTVTAAMVSGQGIGDRNRPQGLGFYRIAGKVYLPDGHPASNVRVYLSGTETTTNTDVRTNQDGQFEFSGLGAGNYSVSVREQGYRMENESLNIAGGGAGEAYQVVIHLRSAAETLLPTALAPSALLKDIPKPAADKYQQALDKISKDDPKAALALLDAAIAAYPNFAAAYYEKGSAYLKLNELDNAIAAFVKAIELKADYLEAKYGYGLAMYQKKDFTVSAAAFNDVLQQKPDMIDSHLYLGISLFNLKNVDGAEKELKAVVDSPEGQKLALAHLYLGQIYSQKKRNADAVQQLEKYLELVPKAPNADRVRSAIAELKKQQ